MTQSAIATAADYADAMVTARRAKNILISLILLILVVELSLFFVAHFKVDVRGTANPNIDKLKYLIGVIGFLGVILPAVLSIDLLLLVMIMLVGRLIGVSRLVAAFLWSVVLGLLLFPWQAILVNQAFTSSEFKVPGVLYSWAELLARSRQTPADTGHAILFWARFVGFPVVAILVALIILSNSRRGLRLALGEITPEPIAPSRDV